MANLSGLRADKPATMEVEDNRGVVLMQVEGDPNPGKPITWTFKGIDSPEWQRKRQELFDQKLERKGVTGAQLDNDTIELIAAVSDSWEGIGVAENPHLPHTRDNARLVLRTVPALMDQANKFLGKRDRFDASSTTS